MIRLFTAIEIPEDIREELSHLKSSIENARWLSPKNYHLTLTFIGDIDETQVERIDTSLLKLSEPNFSLEITETGFFGHKKDPRILWAGIKHNESLNHLKNKVDVALDHAKIDFEHRHYTPHITLARMKNANPAEIGSFMEEYNLFHSRKIEVNRFALYQSHLTNHGSQYEVIKTYPLSPSVDEAVSV